MSYSRANELVKQELLKEGLEPRLYGIHSLIAGAAAVAAGGIRDRLI